VRLQRPDDTEKVTTRAAAAAASDLADEIFTTVTAATAGWTAV